MAKKYNINVTVSVDGDSPEITQLALDFASNITFEDINVTITEITVSEMDY